MYRAQSQPPGAKAVFADRDVYRTTHSASLREHCDGSKQGLIKLNELHMRLYKPRKSAVSATMHNDRLNERHFLPLEERFLQSVQGEIYTRSSIQSHCIFH